MPEAPAAPGAQATGRPLVIGLTGGIGSGKSTVARLFESRGVPVIDADVLSRTLVSPGEPALEAIVEALGRDLLTAGGELDRRRLRERAFSDPAVRRTLEGILHPRIRAAMQAQITTLGTPYCVLAIPLLLETGQTDLVDRVLVVDVSPETQLRRTMERDGSAEGTVRAIIAAQVDRAVRLAGADDVLNNESGVDALERDVARLHQRYLALARGDLPAPDN